MNLTDMLETTPRCEFYQDGLLKFGEQLPNDDSALDALIGEAVRERDEIVFRCLVFACVGNKRTVDAKHLIEGAILFEEPVQLAVAAWHCTGDVAVALVTAVVQGHMGWDREACALLVAAGWCERHRAGAMPADLLPQARKLARKCDTDLVTSITLLALSDTVDDEGLKTALTACESPLFRDAAARAKALFLDQCRTEGFQLLPDEPHRALRSGYTVRRAVERIGRNDPCPCGSGKKYKKCCYDKDQQRLRRSSDVAGVTLDEIRENPEQYLTMERMRSMRSYELARLDPAKVSKRLHRAYLDRLLLYEEHDAVVQLFESTGYRRELMWQWQEAVSATAGQLREDLVRRLLALRPDYKPEEDEWHGLRVQLLLGNESGTAIEMIENKALDVLRQDESVQCVEFAHQLLGSRYGALGVHVARGVLSFANEFDSEVLLETLIETRERLHLSSQDVVEPLVQKRLDKAWGAYKEKDRSDTDSQELGKLRGDLGNKNKEVRSLRQEVSELQAALTDKSAEVEIATEPTPETSNRKTADPSELRVLRQRLSALKDDLKERHQERNQLRAELARTRDEMRAMSKNESFSADHASRAEETREDELLTETETFTAQPVRIPVFPKKFHGALGDFPQSVARAAIELAGRLAAGDVTAFRGVKRLKRQRELFRQRVGAAHRLLFRLEPQTLTIVALIQRRDLERFIRNL